MFGFFLTLDVTYTFKFFFIKYEFIYTWIKNLNHPWWNYFCLVSIFFFFIGNFMPLIYFLIFLGFTPVVFSYTKGLIPETLLIGYNNIHPPLLYIGVISYLFILLKYEFFIFKKKSILIILIIAFYLGALWGCGNSVWGFFWVNDKIELILLLYTLSFISLIHKNINNKMIKIFLIYIYLLFISILMLRWGLKFTRHNFFDFTKGHNFIFSYLITIRVYSFIYSYILVMIFYSFNYISVVLFLLTLFFYNKTKFMKNIILHIFLSILFISWLKFKTNNFIVYGNLINFNEQTTTFSHCDLLIYNKIFINFLKFKKIIYFFKTKMFYSFKFVNPQMTVFINSSKFFLILLLLISI